MCRDGCDAPSAPPPPTGSLSVLSSYTHWTPRASRSGSGCVLARKRNERIQEEQCGLAASHFILRLLHGRHAWFRCNWFADLLSFLGGFGGRSEEVLLGDTELAVLGRLAEEVDPTAEDELAGRAWYG